LGAGLVGLVAVFFARAARQAAKRGQSVGKIWARVPTSSALWSGIACIVAGIEGGWPRRHLGGLLLVFVGGKCVLFAGRNRRFRAFWRSPANPVRSLESVEVPNIDVDDPAVRWHFADARRIAFGAVHNPDVLRMVGNMLAAMERGDTERILHEGRPTIRRMNWLLAAVPAIAAFGGIALVVGLVLIVNS
jgi:hypothetical protein